MSLSIEVLASPAEYQARAAVGFAGQTCVVFDVLRATSVMVTGLAHGASGFLPVAEISEAVAWRRQRAGLRITAAQSGGVDFDLGNSPREFTAARVEGRTIVTTTTNGTRALRACATADVVLVGAFLNLGATVRWLVGRSVAKLVLVCAGTGDAVALEDVLCAGALCDRITKELKDCDLDDAAAVACGAYREAASDLFAMVSTSRNGQRLLANPELREDVAGCLRRDVYDLVGLRGATDVIRAVRL
jgi:2-phosphosulfolactate phosphatase